MRILFAASAALLCACAPATSDNEVVTPGPAPGSAATSITYETSPCFGMCPVYRVTVHADGTGRFEGRHHTAVSGPRDFTVSAEQYRTFAAHLEPLRPASGSVRLADMRDCQPYATDMPSGEVIWEGGAERQSYFLYFGCAMDRNGPARDRLRSAVDLLPIADFIGQGRLDSSG